MITANDARNLRPEETPGLTDADYNLLASLGAQVEGAAKRGLRAVTVTYGGQTDPARRKLLDAELRRKGYKVEGSGSRFALSW